MNKKEDFWLNWIVVILLALIWGSAFILMKIGSRSLNSFEIAGIRNGITGLLTLPWFILALKQVARRDWKYIFACAWLGSGIPSVCYAYASAKMDSNVSGVINALTPIFTLIVGFVLFKKKPSKLAVLGIFLGFLGVFMIIASRGFSSVNLIVAGLPLVSTFFYGINTNLMKEKINHLTSIQMLSCFYGILFLPSVIFLMYNDTFAGVSTTDFSPYFWQVVGDPATQKMNSIVAVLVLGVVGTTATSLIFYFLLKRTNILFATMTTFLIPIVSLFWGYVDGEMIRLLQILSLITILLGVYLVSRFSK